jgi:hypothetical protein
MDVYRPLRAGLFFYEIVRLLALIAFFSLLPPEASIDRMFFPYLPYLSSNALFPLITLFVWLRPELYGNYLNLYMAGKVIGAISFFAWEIFTSRNFPDMDNILKSMILLGGSVLLSLADILSVWAAWTLKNKWRKRIMENGGA